MLEQMREAGLALAGSSFDPTLYHMLTATTGALWSSWTITVRPLVEPEQRCAGSNFA